MRVINRAITGILVVCWIAAFQLGPDALGLGLESRQFWLAIPSLLLPLVAAIACYRAAAVSTGSDRKAWRNFAIASALYFVGNLCYLIYGLTEVDAAFPTFPELAFLVMGVFFTVGMFQYGSAQRLISRIQVYNFGLILCAVALCGLFLLHDSLRVSALTFAGTAFAFIYPVLWFNIASFGLVCLVLYAHPRKQFAFSLLLLAIFCEAVSDFIYADGLMHGTHVLGGITSTLWVLSTTLLIWAAVEQIHVGRLGNFETRALSLTRRRLGEATVPGVAVAAVLVSATVAGGSAGLGVAILAFALPVAVLFALLVGMREYWALAVERDLRRDAQKSQDDLAASRQQLSTVLESTTDSVVVINRAAEIVFFNQRAAGMAGFRSEPALGKPIVDLFAPAIAAGLRDRLSRSFATGDALDFEQFIPERGIWLDVHAFPSPEGLSIFFRDISEAHRIREAITHLAHHDALTGLANRLLVHDELRKHLDTGATTAVLFIDLDHFKEVNDTLGHPVGDVLLSHVAARLRACVRDTDIVGRLGGDEFAVVQIGIADSSEAAALAQRILGTLCAPYDIDDQILHIGASIGISLAPAHGGDPDQLFKNADIALYCAKADERGTYRFFEPEMETRLQTKQRLKTDLAAALGGAELSMAFQPIVDLRSNTIVSMEALLRWDHPIHQSIPPSRFIPIAEETGLIIPIGEWALRNACSAAATWPTEVGVSVNVSAVQFAASNLPSVIQSVLRETGLAPERLELEITESVLLQNSEPNLRTLERIGALGVRIALDDFGTGFASLGYLQKFAFNKIKIDRSFVSVFPGHRESHAIVHAVTGIGRTLGIRITAEGVETRQQLDQVRAVDCDEAQGYFFSRPIPAAQVPALLEKLGASRKLWGEAKTAHTTVAA